MSQLETSCPITADPDYPNIAETQKQDLKTFINIIEVLQEEITKYLFINPEKCKKNNVGK